MPCKSRKLPMGMREPGKKRATTFSKRRQGLFNKVAEICMLSDARVALLVSSLPTNSSSKQKKKFFSLGYPSADSVFDSFLGNIPIPPDDDDVAAPDTTKRSAVCIWQEIMGLVQYIQKTRESSKSSKSSPEGTLVELAEVEKSNSIQELQAFITALEDLREKAVAKMQMQCPQFQGSCSSNSTSIAAADNNNRNGKLGYTDNYYDLYKTGIFDRHSSSNLNAVASTSFWVPKIESDHSVFPETFPDSYLRGNAYDNNGSLLNINRPVIYDSAIDTNMAANSIATIGNNWVPSHLNCGQLLAQDFGYLPPMFKKIEDGVSITATECGNNHGYNINHDVIGRRSNDGPDQYFNFNDSSNSVVVTDSVVAGCSHSDKDYVVHFEPNFDNHDQAFLQLEKISKDTENDGCVIDPGFRAEDQDSNWDLGFLVGGVNNGAASARSGGCNHAIVDHLDHQSLPFYIYKNGGNLEFEDFLSGW